MESRNCDGPKWDVLNDFNVVLVIDISATLSDLEAAEVLLRWSQNIEIGLHVPLDSESTSPKGAIIDVR